MTITKSVSSTSNHLVTIMHVVSGMITATPADIFISTDGSMGGELSRLKLLKDLKKTLFALEEDDIELQNGFLELEHEVLPCMPYLQLKKAQDASRKDCIMCAIEEHFIRQGHKVAVEMVGTIEDEMYVVLPVIFIAQTPKGVTAYARTFHSDMKFNLRTCSKLVFLRGMQDNGLPCPEVPDQYSPVDASELYFHDASVVNLPDTTSDAQALSMYIEAVGHMDEFILKADPLYD